MPTGAPDYVKRIDVNIQTLGEVTIRPRYGDFKTAFATTFPTAAQWNTLVDVSGKGILYGGRVVFTGSGATEDDRVRITIDGETSDEASPETLMEYQITRPYLGCFYLLQFDSNQPQFGIGLCHDVSFESNLLLEVRPYTSGVVCHHEVYYGLL